MNFKYFKQVIISLALVSYVAIAGAAETITYFHNDALGSPVAATDEAGNILWREAYKPYGSRIRKEDGGTNDTWYTGKQEDKATGLSYFGARWYDPTIGRFMGIDPVGFQEGNIHSFNRYAYANNNPYKFVDPDGEYNVLAVGRVTFVVTEGLLNFTKGAVLLGAFGASVYDLTHGQNGYFNESVDGGSSNGDRAGKKHTKGAVTEAKKRNGEQNNGDVVCTDCGVVTTPTTRRTKGSKVNPREGQGDHIHPKSKNGNGATVKDQSNIDIKCASCNNKKSNYLP